MKMNNDDHDALKRLQRLTELNAAALEDAGSAELEEILVNRGVDPDEFAATVSSTIEDALNRVARTKFEAARVAVRAETQKQRPDLSHLSHQELLDELRVITANDADPTEAITIAARSGKRGMSMDELRSIVEDYYAARAQAK